MAQPIVISLLASLSFILTEIANTKDKLLVQGLHSANIEPLNSFLLETLKIQVEQNSSFQLSFTAYDDGSIAFNMLSVEASIYWGNDEYIVKQLAPSYSQNLTTYEVTAVHAGYDIARIRQREVKAGTHTYSVNDVLAYYLKDNKLGYTWQVIGNFAKKQITDLGNGSGKDMLDQIVKTWEDAIFYPEKRVIRIYQHDVFSQNIGNRIDYIHDTPEIRMSYESTNIVNQVKATGKEKEQGGSSNKTEYYFEPFLVEDKASIKKWGVHPGDDVSDDRFTNKKAMETYAKSQLSPEPTLSIEVTQQLDERPRLGEIRRLENRKDGFVTEVEIVGFTHYPLNRRADTITLNNRAKTILNYQTSRQKALQKSLEIQKQQTKDALNKARKAYSSRLVGSLVETSIPFDSRNSLLRKTENVPVFALQVAEDNDDFGLKKGDKFAVQTTASGVKGLDAKIKAGQIKYSVATVDNDGLMSAEDKTKLNDLREYTEATQEQAGLMSPADKAKLDNLKQEPVESIDIIDSSTGSIYKLSISNGEIKLTEVK